MGPVRRWRMVRAVLLHDLLGGIGDRIGEGQGLVTQCDQVHLNQRSGRILEDLAAGFLRAQPGVSYQKVPIKHGPVPVGDVGL